MKQQTINISFNCKEPINELNLESRLSNLYNYPFEMDGCRFESWEGFIQSLKTNDNNIKKDLWSRFGYWGWKKGQNINWWDKQEVYWNGQIIKRDSVEYDNLITKSYDYLFEQNGDFRKALTESLPYNLDHSKGKTNINKTLLTKREYLDQLNRLREQLKSNNFYDLTNLFK